jgi:nodulation protein E
MKGRRVVITGLGVISSLGHDPAGFWDGLVRGRSGIGPVDPERLPGLRFENIAEVRGYDPLAHFEPRQLVVLDRFAQFALVSARQAVRESGLAWSSQLRNRTAVVTGTCIGGQMTSELANYSLFVEKSKRLSPMIVPRVMPNAGASHITMEFGLHGPSFTIASACSSSSHAIGQAYWMVRHGMADVAIAGGSEAALSLVHLKTWEAMRVVAPDTCRPFSKDRRGMILAEGGAMIVLEPLESAQARGATIHGEIVGFGMSADASDVTKPSAEGAAMAIREALRDASLHPAQVGYINAHGTGTLVNDPMETRAIRSVFGTDANRLAVSSTKSMHGHALGAAGAIEAVATVLALKSGLLPPTANFTEPDPECDLDVVPNQARRADVEYALSNSFAFGGLNSVLAFRRWNEVR